MSDALVGARTPEKYPAAEKNLAPAILRNGVKGSNLFPHVRLHVRAYYCFFCTYVVFFLSLLLFMNCMWQTVLAFVSF